MWGSRQHGIGIHVRVASVLRTSAARSQGERQQSADVHQAPETTPSELSEHPLKVDSTVPPKSTRLRIISQGISVVDSKTTRTPHTYLASGYVNFFSPDDYTHNVTGLWKAEFSTGGPYRALHP